MFPELTNDQRRAVTHDGGHLLIVAGAGTGKTTTLAARLAHLVAAGTPPERVCLLTFGRRAAGELVRRAEQLCGDRVSGACWAGTFHAIANRLLRVHGGALGLDPGFTVLDQADAADLLALCRAELDAHDGDAVGARPTRRARKETMASIYSRCVTTATPLSVVLRDHFGWCAGERDVLRATFAAYRARKRAANVVDYDDLLLHWSALLRAPEVAGAIRRRFDHVLVDEYQDTSPLQADLLEGFVGDGTRVTAVGDDGQAIYGFRAATIANIVGFPARFGAEVVVLEDNHRSTPEVLATANAVLAGATTPGRFPKVLRSSRGSGPRPALVACADEGHQSAEVCRAILDRHDRGIRLRDQAVLVRTGHHSQLLELELVARRIPFVKYGGLRFLEAAHVKDLMAVLRLVENPRDELAWFRVLQLLDGVGPAIARRLAAAAAAGDGPPRPEHLPEVAATAVAALQEALTDARALAAPAAGARPSLPVERVRVWLDPVVERRYPAAGPRLGDLDALTSAAAAAPDLGRFLVELTIDPPAATGDLAGPPHRDDDHLTLSTIHSAKGGEWRVVHVIALVDGNLPSDLSTGDADGIEEERRLLYVAATRAADELLLYAPLRQHHHRGTRGHRAGAGGTGDAHGYAALSRFLDDTVLATVERRGMPLDPATVGGADVRMPSEPHPALAEVDELVAALLD